MKQERENKAQLCCKGMTQREGTWAASCHFSPGPIKPHPNLVPPVKDNWLTEIPHQVPRMCLARFTQHFFTLSGIHIESPKGKTSC